MAKGKKAAAACIDRLPIWNNIMKPYSEFYLDIQNSNSDINYLVPITNNEMTINNKRSEIFW